MIWVMEIGVPEASRWLGVTERRVQALARGERLPARKVSGVWLIDGARIGRARRRSRPLSPRNARAFIAMLSAPEVDTEALGLAHSEASRLRSRIRRLMTDPDPASLLMSWCPSDQSDTVAFAAHPQDLQELLADGRLAPSGISDPRSDLAIGDEIQAWIARDDLPAVIADHLLSPNGDINVRLYVGVGPVERPVPLGRLLVDLAQWPGPRESAAVQRLLREALASGRLAVRG